MSSAGCRLLMVRVLFELKAKTGVQPHLYEGPISRSVCSYIHGLYIFIPICGLFCICKKPQKKHVCQVSPFIFGKKKKCSGSLLFLREKHQVPAGHFFFLSARMRQRSCEPLIPTTSSGCGWMCMGAKVGCLRSPMAIVGCMAQGRAQNRI